MQNDKGSFTVDMVIDDPSITFPSVSVVDGTATPVLVTVKVTSFLPRRRANVQIPLDRRSAAKFERFRPLGYALLAATLLAIFILVWAGLMLLGVLPRTADLGFVIVFSSVLGLLAGAGLVNVLIPQYPTLTKDGSIQLKRVNPGAARRCQEMNRPGAFQLRPSA
jgi:hypothetical protein